MKKIIFGVGIILIALGILLSALGVFSPITSAAGEFSIVAIIAGILLFAYAIYRLVKGKFGEIFIPLALIFMLFEKNIAILCGRDNTNIINNWLLFGCACLLQLGFDILLPKRERRVNGKRYGFKKHVSIGSAVKYIDAENFRDENIESDLGSCVIRFENAEKYTGGGVLCVENNLGSMVIEVPSSWRFAHNIDNSLGSVHADVDGGNIDGALLTIKGENNLGSLVIKYV